MPLVLRISTIVLAKFIEATKSELLVLPPLLVEFSSAIMAPLVTKT